MKEVIEDKFCIFFGEFAQLVASGVDCYNQTTRGQDYTGTVNTTTNGHSCKAWTDTWKPSVGSHSYCRNPTWGSSGFRLWCYTMAPGPRWEYCDVPECQGKL